MTRQLTPLAGSRFPEHCTITATTTAPPTLVFLLLLLLLLPPLRLPLATATTATTATDTTTSELEAACRLLQLKCLLGLFRDLPVYGATSGTPSGRA